MLQCNQMDELMLDWLYDELDEDRREQVDAHVEDCARCAAEAGSLRRTRELFDDLPSCAEPPASLTAILLHEAARHAPSPKRQVATDPAASVGLWQRLKELFRPIAMHPAAAAVASLILVAGVAGTLYVRSGSEMAQPERRPDLASGAAASDHSVAATGEGSVLADEAPTEPAAIAVEPEEAEAAAGKLGIEAGLLDGESQQAIDERARRMDDNLDRKVAAKPKRSKRASKSDTNVADKGYAKGPVANAISGSDPLIDLDDTGYRGGSATPPPPTASTSSKRTTRGSSKSSEEASPLAAQQQGTYRPYKDKPVSAQERAWLSRQQVSLEKLAADKKCRAAAEIANDILDRNPDFYTSEVARSKPVKSCSMYVKDEARRRATARSGKAAGGASAGTPAAPVKKARARDEAAAEPSK